MQNEFEKQVQQKMEELNLVPSAPVWEAVELQIRKKKERRRVIFWIPLVALLGAGLWLGVDPFWSGRIAHNRETSKTIHRDSVGTTATNQKEIGSRQVQEGQQKVVIDKGAVGPSHLQKRKAKNLDLLPPTAQKDLSRKTGTADKLPRQGRKITSPAKEDNGLAKNKVLGEGPRQQPEGPGVNKTGTVQNFDSAAKEKTNTMTASDGRLKQDSLLNQKPSVKKQASSKWKYNVVISAGTSGLGRINAYNGQKSMYVYNTPPLGTSSGGGQYTSGGPSKMENGLALTIGAIAKRQWGRRTCFSTGLQYNYYSNTIQVGNKVNQNTRIMDYAVTQFYSSQSAALHPYKNQYHFISVPADLDWQLLKKHPLHLSFGLSFQYLLQSNALRFDYGTQTYFHDIDAFNRLQLVSGCSISYTVPLKQKPLTFGPQVQYGLTRMEKDNPDHHLFSYGLKTMWQFKK